MHALSEINAERMQRMRTALQTLAPRHLDIVDDSAKHAGHAGAKGGLGHFKLTIAADALDGINAVAAHRKIYAALGEMMQTDIHALSISVQR
jgi:BolA family transcriptional regulator, general stress-responsive regulator